VKETELQAMADNVAACSCNECKAMCKRPCWPTPSEALRIMDAGYAERLMLDYWVASPNDIYIISPAEKGREMANASFVPIGGCAMQDPTTGLCAIHSIKPIEGRVAHHSTAERQNGKVNIHKEVAMLWDSEEGRKVITDWKNRINW
jgi:Fe-S-cluster containining protein